MTQRRYPNRFGKVSEAVSNSLSVKIGVWFKRRFAYQIGVSAKTVKDSYVEGRAIPYSTEYVIPSRTATVLDSMTSGIAKLPHTVSCYVCANVAVWVTIKRAARLTLCQIDRVYGKVFDLSSRVLHYSNRVDAAFSHV